MSKETYRNARNRVDLVPMMDINDSHKPERVTDAEGHPYVALQCKGRPFGQSNHCHTNVRFAVDGVSTTKPLKVNDNSKATKTAKPNGKGKAAAPKSATKSRKGNKGNFSKEVLETMGSED